MVRVDRKASVLLAIIAFFLASCGTPQLPTVSPQTWTSGTWPTSSPEEQGIDSAKLAAMLDQILANRHPIDAVLVVRNGTMVMDATVHPFQPDSKHIIHSCTKSIVSALIGIAIEEGYIRGTGQRVIDLFPGRTIANLDANKRAMTLEDLLTMSSGLDCQDSYLYRWRGLNQMRQSDDWVQHVLDLPMIAEPGTRFEYCNGVSFLLSAIIQETTGQTTLDFAREHLFGPLEISDVDWPANPQGINIGWGELHMKPHDMAKIGYLYLHDGRWGEQQVVPAEWTAASTKKYIDGTLQDGYGYQWWIDGTGYYMALGYAGQCIFVIPDLELVVVFVSDLDEADFYVPQILLSEYIVPAIESSGPLPANPEGLRILASSIEALAQPR
jgi:CubicO group peptidase (beta-lactamase class C family)